MNALPADPQARLRRGVYLILILAGTGMMLGRILAVDAVDRDGLERQRRDEIPRLLEKKKAELQDQGVEGEQLQRALAETDHKLHERARLRRPFLSANDRSRWCTVRALVDPDMRVPGAPYAIDRVIQEQNWDTIDMVKHDGHLYSSKPTLLPTLMAAEYWLVNRVTGATLADHAFYIARIELITFNVIPLVVCFLVLIPLIERFGTTDWGRLFAMTAAVFGTFLTTFVVTINNHVPAAATAVLTIYALVRIVVDGERRWWWFFAAGLFAALTAANELPATALLAAAGLVALWQCPGKTLLAFVPGVLVVAAGFFGTNYAAHHDFRVAYAHRAGGDDWYHFTYERGGRQYQSYWSDPTGVDAGEKSKAVYALHTLVGHHGIFSLTPIWLLSAAGIAIWLAGGRTDRRRELALLVAALSLVCFVFYVTRSQVDRNYGGMCCGLRWMFWFAPLWIVAMLPAVDWLAERRWGRALGLVLLAFSALSVAYPTWNPWTSPWLVDGLTYFGR